MSIAVLIKQLRDAGAPMEAIEIAVSAVEAERAKFEAAEATRLAAEEVRKANQRERTAKSRAKSRDGNVTVTAQPRDPSPNEINLTPTHEGSPSDPKGSSAPKGARKPRNRALPADWQPGEKSEAACEELGRSAAWMRSTAIDMRTWAESKGEVRADWDATHVGWMRREAKRECSQPSPPARASPTAKPRFSNGFFASLDAEVSDPDERYSDHDHRHLRLAAGGRH